MFRIVNMSVLFAGSISSVIALSESHLRISPYVGRAITLFCTAWLLVRTHDAPKAHIFKLWCAMLGISALLFGNERFASPLLWFNVFVLCIPSFHEGNIPLGLLTLWLSALTPFSGFNSEAGLWYMWCPFAVLSTYYALSDVTRESATPLLTSILPMCVGLLIHGNGTAAAVYRCIGMLVAFTLPDVWGICFTLPSTPFRFAIDTECVPGSLADRIDRLRNERVFRYGCYVLCTALLVRASLVPECFDDMIHSSRHHSTYR